VRVAHIFMTNFTTNSVNAPKKPLRLALIAMSGAGKTFWTRRIAETGVTAISCDDRIEEKLSRRLAAGGYAGINGVAAWMGVARFGDLRGTGSGVPSRRNFHAGRNSDGTASESATIIDSGHDWQRDLCRESFAAPAAQADDSGVSGGIGWPSSNCLIERYLNNPKPVLWRGAFQARSSETARETVARCYPHLIAARRQSYTALAHATLQVAALRELPHTAAAFLELLPERFRPQGVGGSR